jgi:hypothetical protein
MIDNVNLLGRSKNEVKQIIDEKHHTHHKLRPNDERSAKELYNHVRDC